jgi:hypothetical protein
MIARFVSGCLTYINTSLKALRSGRRMSKQQEHQAADFWISDKAQRFLAKTHIQWPVPQRVITRRWVADG